MVCQQCRNALEKKYRITGTGCWWHELVGGFPYIGNGVSVVFAGFVQDLMFHSVAFLCEVGHDSSMCSNMVSVMAGLEGFGEDNIAVTMVCQHYVLVSNVGAHGEAPHVVCV